MFRNVLVIGSSLALAISLAAAESAPPKAGLSAAQIVDKNVAARGGLEAWRAVKTMSLSGKMGAGGNQRSTLQVPTQGQATVATRKTGEGRLPSRRTDEVYLPFLLEL